MFEYLNQNHYINYPFIKYSHVNILATETRSSDLCTTRSVRCYIAQIIKIILLIIIIIIIIIIITRGCSRQTVHLTTRETTPEDTVHRWRRNIEQKRIHP